MSVNLRCAYIQVAKKEEAAERLASEYQRRMALLKTKEDLETERNRIFNRKSPPPLASVPAQALPLPPPPATVRDVIMKSSSIVNDGAAATGGGGLASERAHHYGHGHHGGAGHHQQHQEQHHNEQPLTAEEEATLEELEERIEALQVCISFT